MAILVIAEHDNASLKSATLTTLGAAARLGGDIHVLVAGSSSRAAAEAAARAAGVTRVLVADAPIHQHPLAENLALLIVELARGYSHVLKVITVRSTGFEAVSAEGGNAAI